MSYAAGRWGWCYSDARRGFGIGIVIEIVEADAALHVTMMRGGGGGVIVVGGSLVEVS
jgi:hypothetical protein